MMGRARDVEKNSKNMISFRQPIEANYFGVLEYYSRRFNFGAQSAAAWWKA
jgi:hypothetical protein